MSPCSTIFEPIISAPALPKTIDSKAPILMIALLITVVYSYVFLFNYYLAAAYGSFAMIINLFIMLYIGSTIYFYISVANICISTNRIKQTNNVLDIENNALFLLSFLWLRMAVI